MEHIHGEIKANGKTLFDNVDMWIEVTVAPNGIKKRWHGSFTVDGGNFLDLESLELELEDGRTGGIVISHMNTTSHSQGFRVFFRGNGPLE